MRTAFIRQSPLQRMQQSKVGGRAFLFQSADDTELCKSLYYQIAWFKWPWLTQRDTALNRKKIALCFSFVIEATVYIFQK